MSEKSKCISHSANPVQKQRKAISDVDELRAINWLGEEDRTVNICRASELAKTTVCTIRHNGDKSYHIAFNVGVCQFFLIQFLSNLHELRTNIVYLLLS
jgi:hypothetical protein